MIVTTATSQIDLRRPNALPGAEVVDARYTAHEFPAHAHCEYLVALITEGAEVFRHDRREVVAPRGALVLLNPFEEHTGRALAGAWRHLALFCGASALNGQFDGSPVRLKGPVVFDAAAARLLARLARLADAPAEALRTQTTMSALARRLRDRHSDRPTGPPGPPTDVRRALERLDDDPAANIGLEHLAAECGVRPLVLLRSFRAAIGCTPHVYRTARRIEVAKAALRRNLSPAAAAADAGFCDQSHLTRVFHRCLGVTPADYRQIARS